jgi:O-antigen ligase/Tfp pilus assembly protein PilF
MIWVMIASVFLTYLTFTPLFTTFNVPKYAILKLTLPILIALWLIEALRKGQIKITRTPIDILLLAFSAISLLSLAVAVNPYEGLGELYNQSILIALYFVISSSIRSEAEVRLLLKALVGAGVIVAAYGLLQVAGADPLPFSSGRGPISTLGNRNYVADLMVITAPLALGLLLTCRGWIWRAVYALSALSMASLLGWTYSKGSLISLSVAMVVFMLLTILYRQGRIISFASKVMVVSVIAAGVILAGMAYLYNSSGSQAAELRDDPIAGSALKRVYLYQTALRMIAGHPAIGVGVGNWGTTYPKYRVSELTNRLRYEQAHNEYLEVAAETGLIGIAFYLGIFGLAAWVLWKSISGEEGNGRYPITVGLASAFIGAVVSALFSFNLQNPASGMAFWMVMGLIGRRMLYEKPPGDSSPEVTKKRWNLWWRTVALAALFIFLPAIYLETIQALRADAYFQRGETASASGDWGEAISMYENSIGLKPHNFEVYFHLGRAYRELEDYPKAKESYERSLMLRPYFEKARNNLGDVYVRMGRYEQASQEFKKALEIYPDYLTSMGNLGLVYELMGRYTEAVAQYEGALRLYPDYIVLHRRAARVYAEELSDEPKARYHLNMFLRKKQSGVEADEAREELKRMEED